MAGETLSPNMNLILPGVGVTAGPTYASDLNSSLTIIDSHSHSAGSGVQITPDGLNISSDLSIGSNNLTLVRSVRLASQVATFSAPADIGCLYESGVDLYFSDGSGNQVRITQAGGVAGTPGSIGSLTSPASVNYDAGSSTFIFQSAASTSAIIDGQSFILRNNSASSKGLTLSPPAAMAADFGITLPALPASGTKFVRMSSAGAQSALVDIDSVTLTISSNVLAVPAGGIAQTNLYTRTASQSESAGNVAVTTAINNSITSSTSFVSTGVTATLVTTGRPVLLIVGAAPGNTGASGNNISHYVNTNNSLAVFQVRRDGTEVWSTRFGYFVGPDGPTYFAPILQCVDTPSAASHVYELFYKIEGHNGSSYIESYGMAITAFEL